jgi:endonuclease YncB( thermonuclease family)
VRLETYGIDDYGRTLATIHVQQGSKSINVNEKMVMCGHAWVMRKYKYIDRLSMAQRNQLRQLEKWARTKRVGLWKSDKPVPPWQWRRKASNKSS